MYVRFTFPAPGPRKRWNNDLERGYQITRTCRGLILPTYAVLREYCKILCRSGVASLDLYYFTCFVRHSNAIVERSFTYWSTILVLACSALACFL